METKRSGQKSKSVDHDLLASRSIAKGRTAKMMKDSVRRADSSSNAAAKASRKQKSKESLQIQKSGAVSSSSRSAKPLQNENDTEVEGFTSRRQSKETHSGVQVKAGSYVFQNSALSAAVSEDGPKVTGNLVCVFCDTKLLTERQLHTHYLIHIEERPSFCVLCDYSSPFKECLDKHMARWHGYDK